MEGDWCNRLLNFIDTDVEANENRYVEKVKERTENKATGIPSSTYNKIHAAIKAAEEEDQTYLIEDEGQHEEQTAQHSLLAQRGCVLLSFEADQSEDGDQCTLSLAIMISEKLEEMGIRSW
jgi:hypothetical protein